MLGLYRSEEKNDSKSTQFLTLFPENINLTLFFTQAVKSVPNIETK